MALNLYDGETQIGECQSWGIPSDIASAKIMRFGCKSNGSVWRQSIKPGFSRRLMREQFRYHDIVDANSYSIPS